MSETTAPRAEPSLWSRRTLALGVSAAALVVLGDLLFWGHEPGISFAVMGVGIIVALLALDLERARAKSVMLATGLAVAASCRSWKPRP